MGERGWKPGMKIDFFSLTNSLKNRKPCDRFDWLLCESEDRSLTAREQDFFDLHSIECVTCSQLATNHKKTFSALRLQKLDYEGDSNFEARVVRLIKVQNGRDSLKYWFPAVLSAGIAAVAAFAIMQILTGSEISKPIIFNNRAAMNSSNSISPQLVLPAISGHKPNR